MDQADSALIANREILKSTDKIYRDLQQHLNTMPLGFPKTTSGVEIRLIQEMFSTEEAKVALYLNYKFATVNTIYNRAKNAGYSKSQLKNMLEKMVCNGAILMRDTDEELSYSLLPFLVGMYEMQLAHFTPSFYIDSQKYITEKFGVEYLTTEEQQFRVIPIEKSLKIEHNVASYDEVREIIDKSKEKIALKNCVCKVGKDLIGRPCKVTERRQICMEFRDYYNVTIHGKMGIKISKNEAQRITDQNEKDGLVILTSTTQNPQFLCGCCSCCCGPLNMINLVPKPIDFIRSNFYATLNSNSCAGCQTCSERCQMNAIIFDAKTKKAVSIDETRCIGCGLCVTTCKTGSLKLKKKEDVFIPPKNHDDLFELIMKKKKSEFKKREMMLNAMMGKKV